MSRFEPLLTAFFLATWVVGFLALFGVVDTADRLPVGLYMFFSVAAAAGWVFGNVFVWRGRAVAPLLRRGLFVIYYLGPPGSLLLLRSMALRSEQAAAPLVPLYSWVVFSILFLVPVVLARTTPRPPNLKVDDGREE